MTVQHPQEATVDAVAAALFPLVERLEALAAGEPTQAEADEVVAEIAALLPDERPADLLDEVARADVPGTLRAAAARRLLTAGLIDLHDELVRRLLAEVGPPARLALARGLHDRGDHERARGLVQPLLRAVHDDVRQQAQLLYRWSADEYETMALADVVRDAEEPGWLHRSFAARELLRRGEVATALWVLDSVVGQWTHMRDDAECVSEPLRVVHELARHRDEPRARALLERAAQDPDPAIRRAAADALAGPPPAGIDLTRDDRDE